MASEIPPSHAEQMEFLRTFPKTETVLRAMQAQGSVSSGTLMTKAWISELREAFDEDRRLLDAGLHAALTEVFEIAGITDEHGSLKWVFIPDQVYVTSSGSTEPRRLGFLLTQVRHLIDGQHRKNVEAEAHAAALADRLTRYEWQPIETAAKDEYHSVLGHCATNPETRTMHWDAQDGAWIKDRPYADPRWKTAWEPTHWMELPENPAIAALPQDGEAR